MTADVVVARARLQEAQGYLGDASNRLSDIREPGTRCARTKEAVVLAGNVLLVLRGALGGVTRRIMSMW